MPSALPGVGKTPAAAYTDGLALEGLPMNAAIHPLERLGVDDYLQGEQRAEVKHEYLDGQIVPMGGASRAHGLLALSLNARNTMGGTAPAQVRSQLQRHRARL